MPANTPSPAVQAWRDHDTRARELPGMSLGRVPLGADPGAAERLWAMGARRAGLDAPVALAAPGPAAARAALDRLSLVRDLTARAVLVDRDLNLPADRADQLWKVLSHLQPPRTLTGPVDADTALHAWRTRHYLCRLVRRRGPGFLQIRDRRWGTCAGSPPTTRATRPPSPGSTAAPPARTSPPTSWRSSPPST